MNNNNETQKPDGIHISGGNTGGLSGHAFTIPNFGTDGATTTTSYLSQHGCPQLVNHRVTETTIELTYTAESRQCIANGMGVDISPAPLVYKEIYNRFDGGMKRVEGRYIPPYSVDEEFEFDGTERI